MSLHLIIYLSQKIQDKFTFQEITLLGLRRQIHHLTRMPDVVVRSLIEEMLEQKILILKKVEAKPIYSIDNSVVCISLKKVKQLEGRILNKYGIK